MDVNRLENLGQITAEADALGGPTPEQVEEQAAQDDAEKQAREWGLIPFTIGSALAMFAPELRQVYTEDACLQWGHSMVPVAEKYGWSGGSKFPELALLLSTAGLVLPTVFVIRARIKDDGKAPDNGPMSGLKSWWREWKAKRAAKVVGDKVEDVKEAAHGGSS